MTSISIMSLTPDFSRVLAGPYMAKPFTRFLVKRKAVETADNSLGALSTWLQPGVDEIGTFLRN